MARTRSSLPLLPLAALSLAVALLLAFPPAASARGWGSLEPKFTCNPASNYGMWFKYGCNCQNMSYADRGYPKLWATCPGVNPTAFGRRAFGNVWLDSVGYGGWVSELIKCANKPFRGGSYQGQCLIPGIFAKPYWVGGGPTPGNRAPGIPWNHNPEPPYL